MNRVRASHDNRAPRSPYLLIERYRDDPDSPAELVAVRLPENRAPRRARKVDNADK